MTWSVSLVLKGSIYLQVMETKKRETYCFMIKWNWGHMAERDHHWPSHSLFPSIHPSHSVMTMNLHQCPHQDSVPGPDLSIASVEIPVQYLPLPLSHLPCAPSFHVVLKPRTSSHWLALLCWSHSLPMSLNSFLLFAPRPIYVHHHLELTICVNPDKNCFWGP